MFPFLRILIGLIFVVSGGEKLIWPYQNFLYVIQGYQLIPSGMDKVIAHVFPWIEFMLGLFMILGLWLPWTLRGVLMMICGFILIVSQALLRGLNLDECGCFGELVSFPLHVVLMIDSTLFLLTFFAVRNLHKTSVFSLDRKLR